MSEADELLERFRPTFVQAAADLEVLAQVRQRERHEPTAAATTAATAEELRELLAALPEEPSGDARPGRQRGAYLLGHRGDHGEPPLPPLAGRVDRGRRTATGKDGDE